MLMSLIFMNRNETADAYMRLYTEDNKRVSEAVYGRKYKLRVGVNNLDGKTTPVISFTCSPVKSQCLLDLFKTHPKQTLC